jgi:hypothetical protein
VAKTPEAKVKEKIRDVLDSMGIYYTQTVTGGYGVSGPLDFSCSMPPGGRYLGIEAKSVHTAYGRKGMTMLQQEHFRRILASGASALVIDENNIDQLQELIECSNKKTTLTPTRS